MPTKRLAIIGSGGHARVVLDAWIASGREDGAVSIYDEDCARAFVGGHMTANLQALADDVTAFHLAIGDNAARVRLDALLTGRGLVPATIRHPAASIAPSAAVGPGAFIAAGAIVGPAARIGASSIVNHRAVVDHECDVGPFCHIAPGAVLGGAVVVDRETLIGANATILPNLRIAARSTVGAGAVVTRDLAAENGTWIGVPARKVSS